MRPAHNNHNHQILQRDKGKAKQLDATDALAELNQLLESLRIPISLPDISVVTSSLLLAVIESILERRFLALNDSTRTSRSPQSRSNCLKIIIKALSKYLDPIEDRWSPDSINFTKLVEGDANQVVIIINGLLKLSKQSFFPHHHKDTSNNAVAPLQRQRSERHPEQRIAQTATTNRPSQQRTFSKRIPIPNQSTSLSSNSSSLSFEPSKTPFDGLFSPGGPRFDESSLPLTSRAGSTTSSNNPLARSFNRNQHEFDAELTGQISNPPTLRNLLRPLQAQMISSKRPQSPRTAHRVMVNKLRNEGVDDEIDQILNHDTDASLSTNIETEEEDETLEEESLYQYPKGSSMLTLDGIEPDDPFVSMETRRAMESQLIQNQTAATFDLTQWAVDGNESHTRSLHYSTKNQPPQWKPHLKSRSQNLRSHSSSSAISSCSVRSHHAAEFVPLRDGGNSIQDNSSLDLQPVLDALPSPKSQSDDQLYEYNPSSNDETSFAGHHITHGTDCGFGKTRMPSFSTNNDFLLPNPTLPSSVPLPPSPSPSIHEHSHNQTTSTHHKVLLASEGAQLNLVVADVIKYEREKEDEASKIEDQEWSDIEKLSQESQRLQSISPSTSFLLSQKPVFSSNKLNLISKKLELLKLLNRAYTNTNPNTTQESHNESGVNTSTAEKTEEQISEERSRHDHQELERIIEKENQEKNVRIRVTRRQFDGIYPQNTGRDFDEKINVMNSINNNRLIVLNRYNLLPNLPSSFNQAMHSTSSATRSPSFDKQKLTPSNSGDFGGNDLNRENNPNPTKSNSNSFLLNGDFILDDVI